MKKEKVELKFCPFCGGLAEIKQCVYPMHWYYVQCGACGCRTDSHVNNRFNETAEHNLRTNIDFWNRRANKILGGNGNGDG